MTLEDLVELVGILGDRRKQPARVRVTPAFAEIIKLQCVVAVDPATPDSLVALPLVIDPETPAKPGWELVYE